MWRHAQQPGFTLLELTLVLVIISIVLAVASPSLSGWRHESELRDAADDLVAVTRLARTQAITQCKTYRLCLPQDGGYYLLELDGTVFQPVASDFGTPSVLAQNVRVELSKEVLPTITAQAGPGGSRFGFGQSALGAASTAEFDQPYIDFFPNGRTEPARLRVMSEQAGTIEIACASPAEPFEIVSPGAVR